MVRIPRSCVAYLCLIFSISCTEQTVAPGTSCSGYQEICSSDQSCVGSGCYFNCDVEGDCDPGYHCVDQSCLPRCEKDAECGFPAACRQPDSSRDIRVCVATTPSLCQTDAQCRGVCNYGTCTVECETGGDCGSGACEYGEADRLVCYVVRY